MERKIEARTSISKEDSLEIVLTCVTKGDKGWRRIARNLIEISLVCAEKGVRYMKMTTYTKRAGSGRL